MLSLWATIREWSDGQATHFPAYSTGTALVELGSLGLVGTGFSLAWVDKAFCQAGNNLEFEIFRHT